MSLKWDIQGLSRKTLMNFFWFPSKLNSTICGLANSKLNELMDVALAIKPAVRGRIHIYTQVNFKHQSTWAEEQTLEAIHDSIGLARNYCADVEWSAFDAPRSQPDSLCKAIETAIKSGARTISISDSLGLSSPIEFSGLLNMLFNWVSNIDRATISVHCHDDMGLAVENSIAALSWGVRQIECSINGLGARKGNADLGEVVNAIINHPNYSVDVEKSLIGLASELVAKISKLVK